MNAGGMNGGDRMEVAVDGGRESFSPGEWIEGTASWHLAEAPESVELRLLWYTRGKGDQDMAVVEVFPFAYAAAEGRKTFRLRLPAGPYSFSGKLISLVWAVELVAEPGARAARAEITVAPGGREILLHPGLAGGPGAGVAGAG
jgi:hypothetical protein